MSPSHPPPTELPIEACIDDLRAALAQSGEAVVQAPPGAGKTTIVPLRLLDEAWLERRRIVVLEPRRVATRAAARRMADLLGEPVGRTVGYRTRDESVVSEDTRVEVVTEGMLTRRLQRDPALEGTGLVVFDEIHERNLQADLALALVLDARPAFRPDLRLLAMSATLDTERVAQLLGGDGAPAPVITSEGRAHPVVVEWRPADGWHRPTDAVPAIVREAIDAHRFSDVLVFLAGAADIRRAGDQLRRAGALPPDVDVRPLFGALSADEQDLALRPSPAGRRRVVLATDIAETSLTVDGVRVVVDSGEVRTPRYDLRSGLTRLHTGPNSRASTEQRAGRAGRLGPGVAYRLWSPAEQAARAAFAAPEITTVDLAGVALELAVWGAEPDDLRFLDPPPSAAFDAARTLLTELGALDGDGRVTDIGRAMVVLPVHPRLARMIVSSREGPAGSTACVLAALLEERDVLRGRPDDLPSDVNERVRLIVDAEARHPDADAAAVRLVRRRARELERRASVTQRPVDLSATGTTLALAYPDRLAQARGGGRFQLRHGERAWLPTGDALTGEAFVVVAALGERAGRDRPEGDLRIHLAAALDADDVEAIGGASIEDRSALVWDSQRDDLRRRTERRLGALVLTARDGPAERGEDTSAALLAHVRAAGLDVLRWTPASSALRARVAFTRETFGESWPDLSDDALLASVDEWLAPYLHGATRRADLERIDLTALLRDRVGRHRLVELDRLAPTHLTLATGRTLPVDYEQPVPRVASRVQDFYGTTGPLAVADGRVPVVVELRSPAGRPVQVTADLPGFWRGSWAEVRKDLAGRYPKHAWPAEPTVADAQRPTRSRSRRRPRP